MKFQFGSVGFCGVVLSIASFAHAADPIRDAESSLRKLEDVERIKLDLKDSEQIEDARDRLDAAMRDAEALINQLTDIQKGTTESKLKDKRARAIDRVKHMIDRLRKSAEILKSAGSDPKKAKDSVSPIRDSISDRREVGQTLSDLSHLIQDLNKSHGEAKRNAKSQIPIERKQLANAVGWPVQSVDFELQKGDLSGGSTTTTESREWAQAVGCPGDQAGHIRGNALGGKGGKTSRNIFPQAPSVNMGAFRSYEAQVRKWVETCHASGNAKLVVKVSFTFGDSVRPERPRYVHYTIKGGDPTDHCKQKTMSWSFENPRSSTCKE